MNSTCYLQVLSLVGTADGGITPPLMEVQEAFLEDNASKSAGILAYSSELVFSAVLLCAMYRVSVKYVPNYLHYIIIVFTKILRVSICYASAVGHRMSEQIKDGLGVGHLMYLHSRLDSRF